MTKKKAKRKTKVVKRKAKRKPQHGRRNTAKRGAKKKVKGKAKKTVKGKAKKTVKGRAKKTAKRRAKKTAEPETAQKDVPEPERRAHPRFDVSFPVRVEAELYGYDWRDQSYGEYRRLNTSGYTVNLSLGGMRVRVKRVIAVHSHCLIHFPGAKGRIEPDLRWATVLESESAEGECELRVQFDSPLDGLDVDGLLEDEPESEDP